LALALSLALTAKFIAAAQDDAPIAIQSARITIAGTSNLHDYTASTAAVHVTHAQVLAPFGVDFWTRLLKPQALAFDVVVPAASLTSPREGVDRNMHKALKVDRFPDITFHLDHFEAVTGDRATAVGLLSLAGVEREVALDLTLEAQGTIIRVHGRTDLVMTDFGIKPPTAMLGMLKTDPRVTVSFDTVFAVPLT
jgi:polyisoprenoid-binding protein YceI